MDNSNEKIIQKAFEEMHTPDFDISSAIKGRSLKNAPKQRKSPKKTIVIAFAIIAFTVSTIALADYLGYVEIGIFTRLQDHVGEEMAEFIAECFDILADHEGGEVNV